jgi:hypothetical protein
VKTFPVLDVTDVIAGVVVAPLVAMTMIFEPPEMFEGHATFVLVTEVTLLPMPFEDWMTWKAI